MVQFVKDRGTGSVIGNSLLRTVLGGKIDGRKTTGRPRMKLLDGIMTKGNTKLSYSEVKLVAHAGSDEMASSQPEPATSGRELEEKLCYGTIKVS